MKNITIEKVELDKVSKAELAQIALTIYEDVAEWRDPIPSDPPDIIIRRVMKADIPDRKVIRFIIKEDNNIIGHSKLWLNTGDADKELISISIYITPKYRRRGIPLFVMKSMIHHFPDIITKISFSVRRSRMDERHYIEDLFDKMGAKMVYMDRQSASKIQEFNQGEVLEIAEKKKQEIIHKGFEIIEIEDAKFEKFLNYPEFIEVVETLWNDMPREDGTWDDEVLDEEKHKAFYKDIEEFGDTVWTYVAIHKQSGNIAGMTETWVRQTQSAVALQDDTGVLKEYRGNGLGLTLKYQMLSKLLSDPRSREVIYWITGNADSNSHMLKINDTLRYRPVSYYPDYEISRLDFEKYLRLQ